MKNLFEIFRKRKPFNLEKALAGEPVVTRDGREVTGICNSTFIHNPLEGRIDGERDLWKIDGRYFEAVKSQLDLFMK